MRRPCASKGAELTWAIIRKTLVDGGKRRNILGVLVVPGEVMDNQPILDLLWRFSFRWRVRCKQATGDAAYGTVEIIKALEDAHIRAYIPIAEKGQRTN